jgi:predicted RNA-binding protein YlqC (UPF0109 family)
MQELVAYIAKQLVEHPDQVEVSSSEQDGALNLTLKVAESDKGKVIGKQGKVVKAIRALVGVAAQKLNKKANLEIA